MSNIFTYRPKLQYVYEQLKSVQEVLTREELDQISDYLPALNTQVIQDYLNALNRFYTTYEAIKNLISGSTIQYNKLIPGSLHMVLENYDGGHEFLKTGEISIGLLDELRRNPIFAEIVYNIDNADKGIKGNITFESYKVLKQVYNLSKYYQQCLDKTLFLWYNVNENEDIVAKLREGILLNVEDYLKSCNGKQESILKYDDEAYEKHDFALSCTDQILSMTNNAFYITEEMTKILNFAALEYSDLTDTETMNEYHTLVKEKGSRLLENSQLQNKEIKVMLYNSFKKHQLDMNHLEVKSSSMFSPDAIFNKMNNYGRASKYYHDVCVHTTTSLKTLNDGNGYGYVNSLLDGLSYMSKDYVDQSVQMNNYLLSFQEYFGSYTDSLFKKNEARDVFNCVDAEDNSELV